MNLLSILSLTSSLILLITLIIDVSILADIIVVEATTFTAYTDVVVVFLFGSASYCLIKYFLIRKNPPIIVVNYLKDLEEHQKDVDKETKEKLAELMNSFAYKKWMLEMSENEDN